MNTLFNQCLRIEDIGTIPNLNQIISSTFKTLDFELGNVNETILKNYTITDCLAWGNFGDENFWKIRIEVGDCNLNVYDKVIEVEPHSVNEANAFSTLIIPSSNATNITIGQKYLVIRKKNVPQPSLTLRIQCSGSGLINNQNYFEFTAQPDLVSIWLIFLGNENNIDYWEAK